MTSIAVSVHGGATLVKAYRGTTIAVSRYALDYCTDGVLPPPSRNSREIGSTTLSQHAPKVGKNHLLLARCVVIEFINVYIYLGAN